jgi:hypothetical protein
MITIEPLPDGGAQVQLSTRQPLLYLDQWALYKFANEEPLKTRLLRVFETKGTLMFSWMNVAEIATLQGDSRKKIEALLAGIGVQWFALDVNVAEVMEREDEGRKLDAPFDAEFVAKFYPFIHGEEVLSLSKVVTLTEDDVEASKALLESHKSKFLEFIAEKRAEVKKQPELVKNFATVPFDPNRPSRHAYFEVFRPIISDPSLNLSRNDTVDVFHTVVAAAYCDVVLLDVKWATMVRKLQLPPNRLRVYSPNELDAFLGFMERAQLAS